MESSSVYWLPVFNVLEEEMNPEEMMVVNARHIKAVPGRKTDVKDAEWIADLLQHGMLRGNFIPDRGHRELRELVRHRRSLINQHAQVLNRIQKVLEGANIKLGVRREALRRIPGAVGRNLFSELSTRFTSRFPGFSRPRSLLKFRLGRNRASDQRFCQWTSQSPQFWPAESPHLRADRPTPWSRNASSA